MNTLSSDTHAAAANSSAQTITGPAMAAQPRLLKAARHACLRVAPLWPLDSFVAVNPFAGLVGHPFADVCGMMEHITHQALLMSADYFQQRFDSGRISHADLAEALRRTQSSLTQPELIAWLRKPAAFPVKSPCLSLTDLADARTGGNWGELVMEEISKACAAYFDENQSAWRMPWRKLPLYAAWRQAALIDATPEIQGLKGFRARVAALPEDAVEAVQQLLGAISPPPAMAEHYLHRLLMSLPGWSSYVQYRVRERAMRGEHDESLLHLLAVRLVFETQLLAQFEGTGLKDAWLHSLQATEAGLTAQSEDPRLVWHAALEAGYQRDLCFTLGKAAAQAPAEAKPKRTRPAVQAVFCIDVRSEVMRRALETTAPEVETLGFAGFFGMPVEYVPFGKRHGTAQVPVLLSPKYKVREHLPHASTDEERHIRQQLQTGRRLSYSWNSFKTSAISCFSFVETAGLGYAWQLVKDAFWHTHGTPDKPNHAHDHAGCQSCGAPELHKHKPRRPSLLEDQQAGVGIPPEDQVQLALGALKNMGLTTGFSRLVLICGHGSATTNNPYAAGLDCGACGGHAGDANARVAAAILNHPPVRTALAGKGVFIPQDTHFLPALHNTTTDEILLLDRDEVPASHEMDLAQLQLWLADAAGLCRQHRAGALDLPATQDQDLGRLLLERSRDWAQVRPEWGLAGNAAFIAAPRERTRGLDLKGRVFLHNYRHAEDTTLGTLELILTAPMVVASWINYQYFASTVNNAFWGSGTKVTHNVVGAFGIQQGNGGDLKLGLPLQSVHDGEKWVHEPLRLSVFIEAPVADLEAMIAKHEGVRQLFDNGWLHLFAIEDEGRRIQRRAAPGLWEDTVASHARLASAA